MSIIKTKIQAWLRGGDDQSRRTRKHWREVRSPVASSYFESLDFAHQMRAAEYSSDIVAAALGLVESEIVGSGIIPAPAAADFAGTPAEALNQRLSQLYAEWQGKSLADGSQSEPEAQRLLARLWWRDGETFCWLQDDGTYSILESTDVSYGSDSRRGIVAGIEVDARWRPKAYWLDPNKSSEQQHPYSVSTTSASIASLANAERVPASQILHLAHVTRPRQLRGVTPFRAVANRLRGLSEYEMSELDAARIASYAAFFIRRDGGGETYPDSETGELELKPGLSFPDLGPGEEIGSVNVDRPNTALPDFRSAMLRAVAAGLGISYEALARQHDNSYSASRASLLQVIEQYRMHRLAFIKKLELPKYRWLVRHWLTTGQIEIPGMVDTRTVYQPQWPQKPIPQIDPVKESNASAKLLDIGIESRESLIRARGRDPRQIETERARELAMEASNE